MNQSCMPLFQDLSVIIHVHGVVGCLMLPAGSSPCTKQIIDCRLIYFPIMASIQIQNDIKSHLLSSLAPLQKGTLSWQVPSNPTLPSSLPSPPLPPPSPLQIFLIGERPTLLACMARKKVKLAWIQNDAARRATFKKRRKGLLKKVSELSILCGVEACAIVYAPNEPNPEVWPSVQEATAVLNRFKSMPEMEQTKKMMSQEGFLEERVKKAQNQWKRLHEENQQIELLAFMYQCFGGRTLQDLGFEEVCHLSWLLESKLKVVQERIEALRSQPLPIAAVQPAAIASQSAISVVGSTSATTDLVPYTLHNPNVDVVSMTMPSLPSMGGTMAQQETMDHMDPSMEMARRQEMFMYNSQIYWQGAEEAALPPFMDVGNNFAKPYPDSNQSWLDAYFHN